jgi:hypothetical protein
LSSDEPASRQHPYYFAAAIGNLLPLLGFGEYGVISFSSAVGILHRAFIPFACVALSVILVLEAFLIS